MGIFVQSKSEFTTGQIAHMFRWAPRTVAKLIDGGKIKGYRIPTTGESEGKPGDRRVYREDLIAFIQATPGLRMPPELSDEKSLLHIWVDSPLIDQIKSELGEEWKARECLSLFDATSSATISLPQVIIIDLSVGRSDAISMLEAVRTSHKGKPLCAIAIASEDDANHQGLLEKGFHAVFQKPFNHDKITQEIVDSIAAFWAADRTRRPRYVAADRKGTVKATV